MPPADVELTQDDLTRTLSLFWHPVCTEAELDATPSGVMSARLLGRDLAVARLDDRGVAALDDRCPHRSTRLSVGCVDRGALRCAYHGWRWGADGRCVEIPSAPEVAIPSRARTESFAAERRHGLIWVRMDETAGTSIPPLPAADDPDMRVVAGAPYIWPTSAPRRVENPLRLGARRLPGPARRTRPPAAHRPPGGGGAALRIQSTGPRRRGRHRLVRTQRLPGNPTRHRGYQLRHLGAP